MRTRATQADLSRILGCSPNTISNAKRLTGFPQGDSDNTFEIKAVLDWWHVNKDGGCPESPSDTDADVFAGSDSPNLDHRHEYRHFPSRNW